MVTVRACGGASLTLARARAASHCIDIRDYVPGLETFRPVRVIPEVTFYYVILRALER